MTDRKDEFLYRLPNGSWNGYKLVSSGLIGLLELERRMDKIIGTQIVHDSRELDRIMVEVYDAHILRRSKNTETARLGKMSVASAVQKFQ